MRYISLVDQGNLVKVFPHLEGERRIQSRPALFRSLRFLAIRIDYFTGTQRTCNRVAQLHKAPRFSMIFWNMKIALHSNVTLPRISDAVHCLLVKGRNVQRLNLSIDGSCIPGTKTYYRVDFAHQSRWHMLILPDAYPSDCPNYGLPICQLNFHDISLDCQPSGTIEKVLSFGRNFDNLFRDELYNRVLPWFPNRPARYTLP